MKKLNYIYYFIIILFISCSGEDSGSGDGGGDPPPPPPAPAASTLSTPAKDTECLDGENVEFKWSASNNTDSYDIFVKNLLTNAVVSQTTSENTVTITLEKGNPYSWYIISKSNTSTETATSDVWKFYLKGDAVTNYAPFPADLISPKSESSVNSGSIEFKWSSSDVDSGDTLTFDVYLDTSNPPTTKIKSDYGSSSLNHSVNDAGTYYWKVVTTDNSGSNSDSGISKFKVVN